MSDNTLIKIQGVLNDLIDKYRLVFWYDKETSEKILKSAAPFVLDGETGVLSTTEGVRTASPMQ